MSVNFYKNRDPMVAAYKQVIDEKSNIDWALFGYEKQTNDLTLIDKGDGGLEQLFDEFNSSKILYAFCRVMDPNTELTKYVIINWQGEGAPLQRKGVCINHFRDVCDFFKGAHLTINARTEDEVEPQVILNQIERVSAKVNLKERLDVSENMSPVGSNYKRVQPQREISQTEREKFWNRSQEEEKVRQIEEKKRLNENRAKMEKEREEREVREAKMRDAQIKEREQIILKQRESERNAVNAMKSDNKINLTDDRINDDTERRQRSEQMRRQRAEEVKATVSSSSIRNARALFEQNSSAGQMNTGKSSQSKSSLISNRKQMFESNDNQPNSTAQAVSQPLVNKTKKLWEQQPEVNGKHSAAQPVVEKTPPPAPVVETPPVRIPSPVRSPSPVHSPSPVRSLSPVHSPSPVTAPARSPSPIQNIEKYETPSETIVESREHKTNGENGADYTEPTEVVYARNLLQDAYLQESHPLEDIAEEQSWEDPNNPPEEQYDSTANVYTDQTEAIPTDIGLKKARALFDYQAADETEISFDPDDIITHIEQIDAGWWQGLAPDGTYGLFPANYVELID